MKNFLATFILLMTLNGFSQTDFTKVYMDSPEEVVKAEEIVMKACELILSTPTGQMTKECSQAQLLVIQWMEKTEYTFMLSSNMIKCCKKDDLLGVYLAALAKGRLGYESDFEENAVKEFIKYVTNKSMKIKQTGPIKKLIKANEQGQLSNYTS